MTYSFEFKNPSRDEYLSGLNECFPDWGGDARFKEVFDGLSGPIATSFIGVRSLELGDLIAGSAITYRTMVVGDMVGVVGIMTASWTRPESRGQGLFSRIIAESLQLVRKARGLYLLAFVQSDNASSHQLSEAGAFMVPTTYLFSTNNLPDCDPEKDKFEEIPLSDTNVYSIYQKFSRHQRAHTSYFVYPFDLWRNQYFDPLATVSLWRLNNDFAVIKEANDIVKILYISNAGQGIETQPLSGLASIIWEKFGKPSMSFAIDDIARTSCTLRGFDSQSGYLCILPAQALGREPDRPIFMSNGDRV